MCEIIVFFSVKYVIIFIINVLNVMGYYQNGNNDIVR